MLGGAFDREFGFWLPVTQRRWAAAGELFPPKKNGAIQIRLLSL
jgi:hypothetical protein